MKHLPMGWHHTYPIRREGRWCISCFQSKPQRKCQHYSIHPGELRPPFDDLIRTEVIVFGSQSDAGARKLSSGLRYVQKLIDWQSELRGSIAVVHTWTQHVESLGRILPGQRKTVQKEEVVMVQEKVSGQTDAVVVEYDDACDVSQLRQKHPPLGQLIELSRRCSGGRTVISYVRSVLRAGVYHLTFVAFRPGSSKVTAESSGPASPSQRESQDQFAVVEEDGPDGCLFYWPLEPTAPEPEMLEPTAPESDMLEPTAPEPEMLEPTAPEEEMLEPTAPEEEEEMVAMDSGADDPPPPYDECVGRSEGIRGLPPYREYEDPPPPYRAVER